MNITRFFDEEKVGWRVLGNILSAFIFIYLFHRIIIGHWSLLEALLGFPLPFLVSFSLYGGIILLILNLLLIALLPGWLVTKVSVLSSTILDVLFATNSQEALGFIAGLPLRHYAIALALVVISLLAFFYRHRCSCRFNNFSIIVPSVVALLFCGDIFLNQKIFASFYNNVTYSSKHKLPPSSWHYVGEGKQKNYVNNVLIIGESSRADFWSLYGAGENTSPFVKGVPKRYITSFVAPSVNTTLAVPRLLAITDTKGVLHPQNNILALANEGGLKTYWLSTQGYTGQTNNTSSQIADFSKYKKFFKAYSNDFLLLPELEKSVAEEGRKLIVIHTVGSHTPPEKMIEGFNSRLSLEYNSYVNAYLKTVEKTDRLIEEVYNILKNENKSFSIIYVSDHACNIIKEGNSYKELRSDGIKESYLVPFFQIDSDAKDTIKYDMFQSGYNLALYLPYWLNLSTNLNVEKDIFFNSLKPHEVKVLKYNQKYQFFDSLKSGLRYKDIVK